jgi:predicted ATP-binding protein involved in virulence
MHLKSLTIRNFRAIQDITVPFDSLVNVIVGPNAIGKTRDLHREVGMKISLPKFKRLAMLRLRLQQRDPWMLMSGLIRNAIGDGTP